METNNLAGKVALVTGASRGIGRQIALTLAARGADIVVNYLRKRTAAEGVVAEIEGLGRRAIPIKANLAREAAIDAMFAQVGQTFGRCDILVANAASGISRPILEITDKHWDWTMDVNARSILRCARLAVPMMEEMGWGRIVALSSPGSRRVIPHYGVVGLSKATVEALVRYLAVELASTGITVNAVAPGLVETDALTHFPIDVRETISQVGQRSPSGRIVAPEDVAALVAFLCSEQAAMIVGQTITVDGGISLLF